MLKLLLGRDQASITRTLLAQAAAPGRGARGLVIVPEQYSHGTERKLCQLGGDGVSERAEVLTFSRLAQRAFQELGGSARPVLDQGGRLLLMHLAVGRLAGSLQVFRRARQQAGFLSSLLATADECKSYRISPELLLEAGAWADEAEEDGQRLRELGLILGAYDALVAERAEDPRDRLTRLAEALRGTDYLRGRSVFLDGFTDFTPQEKLVLEALLRQAESVTVGLRCDTLERSGAALFAPTRRTALALAELARGAGVELEFACLPWPSERPEELTALERGLAGGEGVWREAPRRVSIRRAGDPYREAELAAEEILRLVRQKGYRFRDITVAARTLEEWGSQLEHVFARYQIPIFLSRMDDILQKPVLTLLTAALDAVSGGYEYEDMFRYLKTGLTGLGAADRDELENYVLRWDIRGGRWTAEKAWSWHPGGYGQSWSDADRALVERLDGLRRRVVAPLEGLRHARASTGRDWAQAVYAFLEEIGLPACLTRRAGELTQAGALREAEEYRQVWQILTGALEQCSDLLGEDPMQLGEFAQLFQLVLSQYQVGTIPVSLDRVTCSDMARVSHASARALFLLGADDESLPLVGGEGGLLTDEDRSLLSRFGSVETALDEDGRMQREMLLIYECCTMAADRLWVSYAAQGLDGAERRPSFLIHRLLELFPGLEEGVEAGDGAALPAALAPALDTAAARGDRLLLEDLAQLERGGVARRALEAMDGRRENLSRRAVEALYRGTVRLSASRMDKVKSCHYAYFLQYGLKAKPRKPAGLDAPEAGTFVHYVLEYVLSAARDGGGVATLDAERVRRLSAQATGQYIHTQLGGLEDKTPRFRYLFRRLAQSAAQVVLQMVEELQASDFEPIAFELGFGPGQALPPVRLEVDGITVAISGFVDRVDGWVHDGRLYVRVMDYKTGHKSFDLTDVWHGLNLQMLLYLFTLEEKGLPGVKEPVVPAGVLYLPAREEHLTGSRSMDPEARRRALDTKLRRSGLILNDPAVVEAMEHVPLGSEARFLPVRVSKRTGAISGEALASAAQLGKLHRHIRRVLRDIAREIGGGDIQADPWYRGERRTACQWCDYASACHFEDGRRGEHSRYLYPVKGTEFWEQVDEEDKRERQGEGD